MMGMLDEMIEVSFGGTMKEDAKAELAALRAPASAAERKLEAVRDLERKWRDDEDAEISLDLLDALRRALEVK